MSQRMVGAAVLVAAMLAPGLASAQMAGRECASLAGMRIEDTNLLSASIVPAGNGLPEYCRVLGYVRPAVNFEVRLPTATWNGKFYMTGCGGFCGRLESDRPHLTNAMNFGLRRNYATAVTDSGHWGTSSIDGRWAWNNRLGEIDWGYRAIPEVTRVAKLLLAAYYGQKQEKAYFAGCSTGGRQALMAAIRNPADFDGIISGSPALDYTGLVATFFAWVAQANTGPDGKPVFDRTKLPLVQKAVEESCDAADGLKDGLIDAPHKCNFNPASLQCKAGESGAACLTKAEVGVLNKWYTGARNKKGQQLFPGGIPLGSEAFWPTWLVGTNSSPALVPLFGRDFVRYMAFADDPGETYQITQFNFETDPAKLGPMGAIYNATDPDLSRFRDRGGKLIVYHGLADAIVTPQRTLDYLGAVEGKMGGSAKTSEFMRLFMIPGFDHCGLSNAGPGISEAGLDPLTSLERWVEEGKAPASIVTTKTDAQGQVKWTRPICPWPQMPKFSGSGDSKQAESWSCAAQ